MEEFNTYIWAKLRIIISKNFKSMHWMPLENFFVILLSYIVGKSVLHNVFKIGRTTNIEKQSSIYNAYIMPCEIKYISLKLR